MCTDCNELWGEFVLFDSWLSDDQRIGGLIPGSTIGHVDVSLGKKLNPKMSSCAYGVSMLVTVDGQVAPPISVWIGEWCHVVWKSFEWLED